MKTTPWMIVAALLAGMSCGNGLQAGELEPRDRPGPTMHTLQEIYQQLLDVQSEARVNRQRLEAMEQRLDAAGLAPVPAGMALVPAGESAMGDTLGEGVSAEGPVHPTEVDAFYMGTTEVSKAGWDDVYTWATTNGYQFDNPGLGEGLDHPVHTVNWYDCVKWANARSEMEGRTACYTVDGEVYRTNNVVPACDWRSDGYRLPTEAEWEKAARGGAANRRFTWTDSSTISHARANYRAAGGVGYDDSAGADFHPAYDDGTYPYSAPIGSFAANGYGLFDMTGNVHEWCWDRYDDQYYATSPVNNPRGPDAHTSRTVRGGSWYSQPNHCRAASRVSFPPSSESDDLGLRLVRIAP